MAQNMASFKELQCVLEHKVYSAATEWIFYEQDLSQF